MTTLVMFRDLPGGPRQIRFADEISRHCLCGKCRMLSMFMYRDPNDHAFCEVCLCEQSDKHGKDYIFCEYERLDVGIHEMYQDHDLVMMLRDQFVECPNKKTCGTDLQLNDLKDHYITCQPKVKCSDCCADVRSSEWDGHKYTCTKRGSARAASKETPAERRDAGKSADTSSNPAASSSVNTQKFRNAPSSVPPIYPRRELDEAMEYIDGGSHSQKNVGNKTEMSLPDQTTRPEPPDSKKKERCPYCDRTVRLVNYDFHLSKCAKSPITCVFCGQDVEKTNKKPHEDSCKSNPQNQPKVGDDQGDQRRPSDSGSVDKAKRNQGGGPKLNKSDRSPQRSKKDTKGIQGQTKNTTARQTSQERKKKRAKEPWTQPDEPSAAVAPNYAARSASPPASCKSSTSADGKATSMENSSRAFQADSQRHQLSGDDGVWLDYMRDRDWCTGFVVMQEWCRANKIGDDEKYARLNTGLVDLQLHTYVPDFLADPSKTNPFECLVIAVMGRVWLWQHLSPRTKAVTWDNVLEYVPPVFTAGLERKAKNYLRRHPVSPDRLTGTDEVDEIAGKANQLVFQPSSNSSDPQHAVCITEEPQTVEALDQDMGNEMVKRAEACHLSELSGENVTVSGSGNPEIDSNHNVRNPELVDCQESLEVASDTPCQVTAKTNSGTCRQARTASPTQEGVKLQTPVTDSQTFQRANIHHKFSEALKSKPAASTSEEIGAENCSNDIKMATVPHSPEPRQKAGSKPIPEAIEKEDGTSKEACSSLPNHLGKMEQETNDDKQRLKCTDIRSIVAQAPSLEAPLTVSEKSRFHTESGEESTDSQDTNEARPSASQQAETTNGQNKQACSSSPSHHEFKTACELFSTRPSASKSRALLTSIQAHGRYRNKTREKYENNYGKKVQGQSILVKSSAVDHLYEEIRGTVPASNPDNLEMDSTGNVTESSTSFPTASCTEGELQHSCSDFCKAGSSAAARTDSNEARGKYFAEMLGNTQAKETENNPCKADHCDNLASLQRSDDKRCQQETSGSGLHAPRNRVLKGDRKCLGAYKRISEATTDEGNEVSVVPIGNEGIVNNTSGVFAQQSHSNASTTTDLRSHSDCLKLEPQHKHETQHSSSGANKGKIASTTEKSSLQEGDWRTDTEQTKPSQNITDIHLKAGSSHQGPESADPSGKALSGPPLSNASSGASYSPGTALQSVFHSLPKACTSNQILAHTKGSGKCDLHSDLRAGRETQQKLIATPSFPAKQQLDRGSGPQGFIESTTRRTQVKDGKADTVQMPPPEVKSMRTKTGSTSVSEPKTACEEDVGPRSVAEGIQASWGASDRSNNRSAGFQVDIACSQPLTVDPAHSGIPRGKVLSLGSVYIAQCEGVLRTD